MRLADVTRWQPAGLDLAAVKAAGFDAVNIQTSGRDGWRADPRWVAGKVADALDAGLGVCLYRWLDSLATGPDAAAEFLTTAEAVAAGVPFAHQVDCEDAANPATEAIWRSYADTAQQRLGRHVLNYSGDWWWQDPRRNWRGVELTPYVMAAPNAGYLGSYPGDQSPHWLCGWGGWATFAALQYAVAPPAVGLPSMSLAAIRDPAVWPALTGRGEAMRSANMAVLTSQTKAKYPGVVVYGIGDAAHQGSPSGHNEDDTPGSRPEDEDADTKPEHRAIDVMIGPAFPAAEAERYTQALVTIVANQRRLLYVIYNRRIWRAKGGWRQETYTGSDPHTNHVHASGEADDDENTAPWVLDIARGDDVGRIAIFYDGTGYGRGDGTVASTIFTWPVMIELQRLINTGVFAGSSKILPTTPELAPAYGQLLPPPGQPEQPNWDQVLAAIADLSGRLAEADNGLPVDADAIAQALRDAVEGDVAVLNANMQALAAKLAEANNGLPADREKIVDALIEALKRGTGGTP